MLEKEYPEVVSSWSAVALNRIWFVPHSSQVFHAPVEKVQSLSRTFSGPYFVCYKELLHFLIVKFCLADIIVITHVDLGRSNGPRQDIPRLYKTSDSLTKRYSLTLQAQISGYQRQKQLDNISSDWAHQWSAKFFSRHFTFDVARNTLQRLKYHNVSVSLPDTFYQHAENW